MSRTFRIVSIFVAIILTGMPAKCLPKTEKITVAKEHYTSQGRDISVLSFTPSDGKKSHPVIFMMYGSLGNLEDAQTRAITEHYSGLLAFKGYQVYALHYLTYFRKELPPENASATHAIEARNLAHIEETVSDGIKSLTSGYEPVAMVGFSFGATLSMDMAATRPDIAAVVDFYGKAYPWIKVTPVTYRAPTLILHGDDDTEAPIENAHELHNFFVKNNIPCDIHIYPGVGHTFNGNPEAEISLDAQKRVLAFLAKYYPAAPVK